MSPLPGSSKRRKILASIVPHYESDPTADEYETAKTLLSFDKLVGQTSKTVKYKSAEVESILQPRSLPSVNTLEAHVLKPTSPTSVGAIIRPDCWQHCPFGSYHYLWAKNEPQDCDNDADLSLNPLESTKSSRRQSSSSQKPEKKSVKKSADHIRRPQNAFMIFSQLHRLEAKLKLTKSDSNKVSNREVSKQIAQWYNGLASQDREKYLELARKIKEVHNMRYPDYEWNPRKNAPKDAPALPPATDEALKQADLAIAELYKALPRFDPTKSKPNQQVNNTCSVELVNSFRKRPLSDYHKRSQSRKSIDVQRQVIFDFLNSNHWYPTDKQVDDCIQDNIEMFESKTNFMKRMQEVRQKFYKNKNSD